MKGGKNVMDAKSLCMLKYIANDIRHIFRFGTISQVRELICVLQYQSVYSTIRFDQFYQAYLDTTNDPPEKLVLLTQLLFELRFEMEETHRINELLRDANIALIRCINETETM